MTGPRRHAREVALQILHTLDVQPELECGVGIARFFEGFAEPEDHAVRAHAEQLVRGVWGARVAVDQRIGQASRNWRIERMSRVDRNLLRIAVYEMTCLSDEVPPKVAINEAIEIAKRFGTNETPAFVNGVLDRVLEGLG